jgi:hypothetical protein
MGTNLGSGTQPTFDVLGKKARDDMSLAVLVEIIGRSVAC